MSRSKFDLVICQWKQPTRGQLKHACVKVETFHQGWRSNVDVSLHHFVGMHSDGDAVYIGKGKGTFFFEDSFYRQDTFNSLRTENSFLEGGQKPPINTTFYEKEKGNGGSALSRHF